jgi:predicted deacylase
MKESTNLFKIHSIDTKQTGPRVLVTAGVHGDEYEPILAAFELVKDLPDKLKLGSVTIVSIVNTSAYSINSRYGEDGLDLARTCPGNSKGTITEKIAFEISNIIRESDYYIDMHTGGAVYDIYPLAGYMLHESKSILEKQRQMAESFNLPVIWGTEKSAQGRTLSVARDANVPAIYVEFGGGSIAKAHIVNAYKMGCINVLIKLGMMKEVVDIVPIVKYKVEDFNTNSGYLQDKMPAIVSGIFIPIVSLGKVIKKGDVWGIITDPNTEREYVVTANKTGLVLLIRASSFVKAGDSLGGILPISKPGNITLNAE